MAYRKLTIVIDCANDEEKAFVQGVMDDISNMRLVSGSDIVKMQPLFERNKSTLMSLFSMIKNGGAKALLSMQGAQLLMKLKK